MSCEARVESNHGLAGGSLHGDAVEGNKHLTEIAG